MAEMDRNYWVDGILGVVTGDALGVPVEFCDRSERDQDPVRDMRGFGTFHLPAGSWSDDSSMTLAALDSLGSGKLDLDDVMKRFEDWLLHGDYTPWGRTFDVGGSCMKSIENYAGGRMSEAEALEHIHEASALTHAHLRSCIACGLYYFMAREILDARAAGRKEGLKAILQKGLDAGFLFYDQRPEYAKELVHFVRLRDLDDFSATSRNEIRSSGYVVDSIEAAVWCLLTNDSYEECELAAVNLGSDTDTVAAIAGGLAGLYYTARRIPTEWLDVIARKEWILELCEKVACKEIC